MITKRYILKQFVKLLICLAIVFCIVPVKNTSSYVTTLSKTCENTFTGEVETKTDTSQKTDTQPKQTNTGDNTQPGLYIAGVVVAVVGVFIIWKYKLKGED